MKSQSSCKIAVTRNDSEVGLRVVKKLNQLEDVNLKKFYLTLFCSLQLVNYWNPKDFLLLHGCKDLKNTLTKEGMKFIRITDLTVGTVFGEQSLAEDKAR